MLDVAGLAHLMRAVGPQENAPPPRCELRLLFLVTEFSLTCHDHVGLGLHVSRRLLTLALCLPR